ncbi:type IV secretion system DNA-binding domain-containing protein [Acidithiobacillus ferrivorans]|nr:type IV secretion system DNA-binding domain-containing protein [Acidithiobacillus ferrivorans]
MDDPNINSGRIPVAFAMTGLTYVTAWTCASYLVDRPDPLILLHNALHPLAFGFMPPILAGVLAVFAGVAAFKGLYIEPMTHIRGIKLKNNVKELSTALKPLNSNKGIFIHPQIQIAEQQECRHMMFLGGSGSGKTSILWPMINQAAARNDKCIIFSFKSDFQEKCEFDFDLLAPWDSRSVRWQLGKDIRTRLHAESLANTLVPMPAKDQIWAQGAQGLLTAVISRLQKTQGVKWGFAELSQAVAKALSNYNHLLAVVMHESPIAKAYLMGQDSKTTASFLAQMASGLAPVINIGVAEYTSEGKAWSVTDWLAGRKANAAIIGYLPSADKISKSWASSIIEQIVSKVLDMSDCDPAERRICMFLDEVPQAGKVPSITTALEAARSKGMRIWLGMQSISQSEKEYDRETPIIWAGQTNIKIIANLSSPSDQKWASDLLGERELERWQHQTSVSISDSQGGSRSGGFQRVKEHVIMPSQFGSDLHVIENVGVKALILTGKHASIVQWGFPKLQRMRPAVCYAKWTLPSFERPDWGAVPPKVDTPEPVATPMTQAETTTQAPAQQNLQEAVDTNAGKVAATETDDATESETAADILKDHIVDAIIPGASMLLKAFGVDDPQVSSVSAKPIDQRPTVTTAEAPVPVYEGEDEPDDEEYDYEVG